MPNVCVEVSESIVQIAGENRSDGFLPHQPPRLQIFRMYDVEAVVLKGDENQEVALSNG